MCVRCFRCFQAEYAASVLGVGVGVGFLVIRFSQAIYAESIVEVGFWDIRFFQAEYAESVAGPVVEVGF